VIIFVRGGETKNVWFYDMQADGRTFDDKRDKITENDIPDILERWKARSPSEVIDRSKKAFFIPVTEIRGNGFDLSISSYRTQKASEVVYEKPTKILSKLKELEKSILGDLEELEGLVG
jgi:type I restriction enzyme M protein